MSGIDNARDFLNFAIDHGVAAAWQPGVDTGDSPYVTVTAFRAVFAAPRFEIRATWHTRDTGTYRLFGIIARADGGWRDVSLKAARAMIVAASPEAAKGGGEK